MQVTEQIELSGQSVLIQRFKSFYRNLEEIPLDHIEAVYSPEIIFKDPVHQIRGVHELHSYLTSLCSNISSGQFEFLDELFADGKGYIKWDMQFTHPRLGNRNITVRGMTQLMYDEKIYFHEDVYDLGEMFYEQLPLIGNPVRWLKRRLAVY